MTDRPKWRRGENKQESPRKKVDSRPDVRNRVGMRARGHRRLQMRRIRKTILPGRQGLTGPRNTHYEHGFWEWSPTKQPPWITRAKNRNRNKIARQSRRANR